MFRKLSWWTLFLVLAGVAGFAAYDFIQQSGSGLPTGFYSTNGRIEATEVDIATKLPGRVEEVSAREGDLVHKGQVVARMDTETLKAELREARAEVARARESRTVAEALVAQRDSERELAEKELKRSTELYSKGHVSESRVDRDRAAARAAQAVYKAARAELVETDSAINAAEAKVDRIEAELQDTELEAPRSGQVLYRLAEPGEVLPAGGKVLTVIDLDDIYMTVFLPAAEAGRTRIGAEARIVLDAARDHPVRAHVTFVAAKAQFTPKQVETREERQKLMFRTKVTALENTEGILKPGMPGLAYIRQIDAGDWPADLQ